MLKPPRRNTTARKVPGEEYLVRREGSGLWHISFTIGRHRFRESSGTADRAAAARLACHRWQEEWDRIKLGIEATPEISLNDAFIRFYKEKSAGTAWGEGSQKWIMQVILDVLGPRTLLSSVDDNRIIALIEGVRTRPRLNAKGEVIPRIKPIAGSTINQYLSILSIVCNRARKVWKVAVGEWSMEEHRQQEAKHREVFLDHEQARRLVDVAVGHAKPILLLALATGLRRENVLTMEWEQVSIDLARAVVIQKGDKRHVVTLPDIALQLLQVIEPDPAKRAGRVFRFGNPRTPCYCPHCKSPAFRGHPVKTIRRSFNTAAKNAGVRDMPAGKLRFHDLRHTFASWVLATGADLKLVGDALGHSDIKSTMRYVHLLPGRKEGVIGAAMAGLSAPAPAIAHDDDQGRKAG